MRPLRAGGTWTQAAADANRAEDIFFLDIEPLRVANGIGMFDFASQSQRQTSILRVLAEGWPVRGPADREKAIPVWRFHELRHNQPRCSEGHMDVPDRAGSAIFSQLKRRGVEPFRNIPRLIDPQKEEWHAFRPATLQGG